MTVVQFVEFLLSVTVKTDDLRTELHVNESVNKKHTFQNRRRNDDGDV